MAQFAKRITDQTDPLTYATVSAFFQEMHEALKDEIVPKFTSENEMIMDFTFNRVNRHRNMRIIVKPGKTIELYSMHEKKPE